MRHPWSVSLLLALAAVAGYAAGIRPVQAQVEAFPFQVGETVTLGFQDKGTRPCWIREIKGMFARCGSTAERDGRLYRQWLEEWVNIAVVESVARVREEK